MKKKRLLKQLEKTFCLPQGALSPILRLEFTSNRDVIVEGCRRIMQYEEHRIRLETVEGLLTFEGDALCVNCLAGDKVSVSGYIVSVFFAEG